MKAGLSFRILLFFPVLVLSACSIIRVTISVLEPATITIPSAITSLSLFPGAGIPDLPGTVDSLSEIRLDPDFNYNRTKRGYIDGIYESLVTSPRFSRVVKSDTTYEFLLSSGLISWEELRRLCTADSTNGVLILKKAVSHDKLRRYAIPGVPCGVTYQMINLTKWTFYQPFPGREYEDLLFSDTIVFDEGNADCYSPYLLQDIPGVLYESFYNTGQRIGRWMSPSWSDSIPRILYTGPGSDLRTAAGLAMNNQWNQAAAIWNRLSEGDNRKIVAHAAFNMALAWERDDGLDQALLWIRYADSLSGNGISLAYRKVLEERVKNKELLDRQLTGN